MSHSDRAAIGRKEGRKELMLYLANGLGRISRGVSPRTLILLSALLLLLAAACSSDSEDPIISSEQQAGGPDYSAIIITTDMAVGHSRILFGIVAPDEHPGECDPLAPPCRHAS
jgi:hypothetical protein